MLCIPLYNCSGVFNRILENYVLLLIQERGKNNSFENCHSTLRLLVCYMILRHFSSLNTIYCVNSCVILAFIVYLMVIKFVTINLMTGNLLKSSITYYRVELIIYHCSKESSINYVVSKPANPKTCFT